MLQDADHDCAVIALNSSIQTSPRQDCQPMDEEILRQLEHRLGSLHARERLKIEIDREAQ
jgi:hypothetical protein